MSVSVKDPHTGEWTMIAGEPGAFVGATSSAAGEMGLVPTPGMGDQDKVLKGNGSWSDLSDRQPTYSGDSSQWDTTPTANSTKPVTSGGVYSALEQRDTAIAKCECLILSANSVSALPYTFSNAAIETDMVCINSVLSNPSAQLSDWTVNTDTAGKATISGTISGSTNITIYMMKSR